MSLEEALALDRSEDYMGAAKLYEVLLASGCRTEEVLLNLALLYWEACDPGIIAASHLPRDFEERAWERFPELLEEAIRSNPRGTRARFWKAYIDALEHDVNLTPEDCRAMLRERPDVLDPAMDLYIMSDGQDGVVEARELMHQCRGRETARERLLFAVLGSAMRIREREKRG